MRKKLSVFLFGVVFLATACRGFGAGSDHEIVPEYVLTYAENQAEDYPTTLGAYRFAELVKEKTGGRIQIQVNADGVLGDETSILEQMQFGVVDFARVSLSPLSEIVPKLNVLQMPYLYTGAEHMWSVLEGNIGKDFLNSFEGSNLVALSWYDAGARSFYNSVKPIRKPEDIRGMRIRVQESELMGRMVEFLGGTAVPMAYDQVYSALQTGRIDGAENNWPSYDSMAHYEVAKYYTVDEHARVPELQLVSKFTWEKLTPEDQKTIRQCAEESARYERRLWSERSKKSEERVKKKGCEVVELTPEEKIRFQEAVSPLYGEFCAEYVDVIDTIVAAGRER